MLRKCTTAAAGVIAIILIVAMSHADASAAAPSRSASDWGSVVRTGSHGGRVTPLWAYEECEGAFVYSEVSAGAFTWGGEQSCSAPSSQSLWMRLWNQTQGGSGNLVGEDIIGWYGDQNYIHLTEHCQSTKRTLYFEEAYGIANGVQLQPYPATKYFYLDCYVAGTYPGGGGGCGVTQLSRMNLPITRLTDTPQVTPC